MSPLFSRVVLDDRAGHLDDAHGDAWRTWLQLSNALALRDWPTVITTVTAVNDPSSAPGPVTAGIPMPRVAELVEPAPDGVSPEWADLLRQSQSADERELLMRLAATSSVSVPEFGHESDAGIPIDVSWPDRRVAVGFATMSDEDRHDLATAGWIIVAPEVEQIAAALSPDRVREGRD